MARVFLAKVAESLDRHLEDALTYIGWEEYVPRGARIFFKPNLTYPTPRPGVTTSTEFVEACLRAFSGRTSKLMVGESDGGYRGWDADVSFASHGLPEICRRYGARLVNLSRQPTTTTTVDIDGGVRLELPSLLLDEIDVFVTLPVPKMHQVTTMTGAIKNQWGCIPDTMRLLLHPYFDAMILEINRLVRTRLALVDGTFFLNRSGPMSGDPVRMDLLLASDSVGAMDATLCKVMGLDYSRIRYLAKAQQRGWIPPDNQIVSNVRAEALRTTPFTLKLTPRNRVVRWAFDRRWAVNLLWNSRLSGLLHSVLYAVAGNPVQEEIGRLRD